MSTTTFVVVFALFVASVAASSPSSPEFSSIPSSDLNLNYAGLPSSYYQYSVDASQQALRYIGWHVEPGTDWTFTAAWTTGCAAEDLTSSEIDWQTCGMGLFKITETQASGAPEFAELRWVHDYQFKFSAQKPISVDVGNEAFWQSTASDYLVTLWFVAEGLAAGSADTKYNTLLNMWCNDEDNPVQVSAMSPDVDTRSGTPNGPPCNYHSWIEASSTTFAVPPNPAFVSSGGLSPSATFASLAQRCNVAVISGEDGSAWWGGYATSDDAAICAWAAIQDAPAAGFASVANGYDVIWTISADATPVIKYHMIGTTGQLTGGGLYPYTTVGVPGSAPGWVTITNFPTTPFFVDAFNSTLVYIVDTNQDLWKLNGASSWTRVKIPVVSPGTGLVGTGPMAPIAGEVPYLTGVSFAPNVAALNVGPDAVYLEDNAEQQGGPVNTHFRLPY